jgi:hypothetical protein
MVSILRPNIYADVPLNISRSYSVTILEIPFYKNDTENKNIYVDYIGRTKAIFIFKNLISDNVYND